jgi:hypothetical protein
MSKVLHIFTNSDIISTDGTKAIITFADTGLKQDIEITTRMGWLSGPCDIGLIYNPMAFIYNKNKRKKHVKILTDNGEYTPVFTKENIDLQKMIDNSLVVRGTINYSKNSSMEIITRDWVTIHPEIIIYGRSKFNKQLFIFFIAGIVLGFLLSIFLF